MRNRVRFALSCAVAALALAFPASSGAVTILLGPPDLSASEPFATCDSLSPEFCSAKTLISTSLSEPGAILATPADGTITSWRVHGAPPARLHLRVVKALGNGQFAGVATGGIAKVSDGVGSNQTAISIAAGNQIGVNLENTFPQSIVSVLANTNAPGAAWGEYTTGLGDGSTGAPNATGVGAEPLVNATVALYKPLLFNLTSTEGPETGGDIVVINGFHLAIATSVTFGGVPGQILVAGNNQVTARAPAHAPGMVNVSVTTAGGSSDESAVTRYTYNSVSPPAPDTTAPKLTGFSINPIEFRAKAGARVSFKSSEAATVKYSVLQKPPGNHGSFKPLPGSFTMSADAGSNKFRFNARLNGKTLKPGRYRLVAVATDELGNAAKGLKRTFKVLP